jgi:uncharacterized membrane protein YedE/YeeE
MSRFVEHLERVELAAFFAFAVLVILGIFFPTYWVYVFSVAVSFVASDLILSLIIIGGKGLAIIPPLGHEIRTKGHSYLAFLFGIVASTLFSSYIADIVLDVIESSTKWFEDVMWFSLALVGVVYFDLQARFYER